MFRLLRHLLVASLSLAAGMAGASASRVNGPDGQTAHAPQMQIAQARTRQAVPTTAGNTVGSVATVRGSSIVIRGSRQFTLRAGNEIFSNDILQTGNDGTVGVAFDDETTLMLSPNSRVTVNTFVYQVSGRRNVGLLSVARGTLTFFAGSVARTGDMRISTPSAALGIRGTTGVVNVPVGARGVAGETRVKLYADQSGAVGRIEVLASDGTVLGQLTQPSTGLAIRLDAALSRSLGQPRFAAVPAPIAPQELARDRSELQQLNNARTIGRQIIDIRRRSGTAPPQ